MPINKEYVPIDNQPTIKPRTVTGIFTRYIAKTLPLAFDESMSYYECLCALLEYINTKVIPALDNNAEGLLELQEFYEELQTYVNDYFKNLDVQEEINNKLDEMAESGQLTDIIAQYLGLAGMIAFDTVADMKLATNLVNGSKCHTLGYRAVNDGGNSLYKIRTITNEDVVDEASIIALYNNTLVAELIYENELKPEQIGAYGDDTHDDTSYLQKAITLSDNVLLTKNYKISNSLILKSNLHLKAINSVISRIDDTATQYSLLYSDESIENVTIDGLYLLGSKVWTGSTITGDTNDLGIRIKNGNFITIKNCYLKDFGASAIDVVSDNLNIDNNTILYTGTFTAGTVNYNFGIAYEGTNCKISRNKISGVIQGIIAGLENENVIISENDISTNGQHGIYIESGNKLNIVNNIIHDTTLVGIKVQLNNVELQDVAYEDIIISSNNIKNCGAQGILLTNILVYSTFKNIVVSNNMIKNTTRGIDLENMSNVSITSNFIEATSKEYGIYIGKGNKFNISNNHLILKETMGIYLANDTTTDYYVNSKISNNTIEITLDNNHGFNLIRVWNGNNLVINDNLCNFIGTPTTDDGLMFTNTGENTISIYAVNNIIHGSRWDIRALSSNNITLQGNIYDTITGITQ